MGLKNKKVDADVLISIGNEVEKIPIIGGEIGALISDYIPAATQRTINDFRVKCMKSFDQLKERVDVNNVNKEEFAELFKSTYLIVVRSHKEERIQAAVNLLSNILLKQLDDEKLSYNELDHFIRALDSLSIGALLAFGNIIRLANIENTHRGRVETFRPTVDFLKRSLDLDPSFLMGLMRELEGWGIVEISIPDVKAEAYGNYSVELTDLGSRFAKAIKAKELLDRSSY